MAKAREGGHAAHGHKGKPFLHHRSARLGNHDGAGLGQCLQPGCQVDGFAQRQASADHHRPGDHANAHCQAELADRIDHGQRRFERHGCSVFMGHRHAKKTHHAVIALSGVGLTAPAAHRLSALAMETPQRFAVALGTQPAQQLGGFDQVIGQNRDLAQVVTGALAGAGQG